MCSNRGYPEDAKTGGLRSGSFGFAPAQIETRGFISGNVPESTLR